ncbi:laminin subunit alpha-1 [Cylas formicarius]|uniref:laminin subunit alpha-1 n=1 Tax=Cylas formicarius TaxID=197179 RepID=UPI0029588E7A|nr:laminin subunit alpha-1 [Cylas formicarius]
MCNINGFTIELDTMQQKLLLNLSSPPTKIGVCPDPWFFSALKFLKNNRGIGNNVRRNTASNTGLWPSVFNLATKAVISANATCGISGREEFCRLSDTGKTRCGICDDFSPDLGKRHPINFAIDGSNRWWQSPALFYGPEYEYVTVTVDLKKVYQISYVILKSGNSPRPGTWILEKSLDGERFEAWQYFARSDKECSDRFGVLATKGKPYYLSDTEVICTSFFSRLTPLENGEVHTSLIQGRPGANDTTPELLEFTKARYVRFRLMGLRGTQDPLPKWLSQDIWRSKKLFYSIRDITIGGQCVCNGHAENCRHNVASGHPECECLHHTCGPNCDKCCALYNQRQWLPGSARDAKKCLPCNCHGHAASCHYDEAVDKAGLSMDTAGNYHGGGVCDNCTDYTTGINCEECVSGYFRPQGTAPDNPTPCKRCDCDEWGSAPPDICIQYGDLAGTCKCKSGYKGSRCDSCAAGYRGYPSCEPCPCDPKGITDVNNCENECNCKPNVEGLYCDRCKTGYFGLSSAHPEGCLACFCSGVTHLCELAAVETTTINTLDDWLITDLKVSNFIKPESNGQNIFSVGNYEIPGVENLYWMAPHHYSGNKLEAYGSTFVFEVQWVVMRGDTSGEPTVGPNMIIVGANGLQIGTGEEIYSSQRTSFEILLEETGWYVIPNDLKDITTALKKDDYMRGPVTRQQFLSVLANIKYILLRGTFHTDQIEALLEKAVMSFGNENANYEDGSVEKCSCPSGYTGLSCESCSFGYVRIYANSSGNTQESFCGKCDCNGHSESCDANTGECFCEHNTVGEKCERCSVGFYGNPLRGTETDCKRCACPLENDANNFSPSCQLDYVTTDDRGGGSYVCTQCPKGYTGDHCEICDDGYYGDPMEVGNRCMPCDCNGGPCDRKTGQCLSCKGNTEGWKCERCKPEHYGDPSTSNCKPCECDLLGSESKQCHNATGQCVCNEKFTGRTCDQCEVGFGNVTAMCPPCSCSPIGSQSPVCNVHTGTCDCLSGVEGFHCDACQNLHYGFSNNGCKACNCDLNGSKYSSCDPITGNCICKSHYEGRTCSVCKPGYWKNAKQDCVKCHCNEYGSKDSFCDQETGKCNCHPGISGFLCDVCLPNYYGNVQTGCIECEPCTKRGHVCGKGGRCVCPDLTIGKECERCALNSWGFEPGIGCKHCNCSTTGSSTHQCEKTHGRCLCKPGYEGDKCDRCSLGYFGYPNCRQCMCNLHGTREADCTNSTCACNEDGSCNCKENVRGTKCGSCKNSTFGLAKDNPRGCTDCFCFGRSDKCVDTRYNWDKIRFEKEIENNEPISSDTISLPRQFVGDVTNSYGGYLTVKGTGGKFSVFLTGNQISLRSEISSSELRISEQYWSVTSGDILPACQHALSRDCFMLILQNVTSIIIQGQNMEIAEVLLDSAKPYIPYNRTSHSIEKCECPPEYSGLSCQNPNKGYYRHFPELPELTHTFWINNVIGIAKACECNQRSLVCDPNTGHCKNCSDHTAGAYCELCDIGYYKDQSENCSACLCPSEKENNAESCVAKKHDFVCNCRKGYTGSKCEYCKDGYYRDRFSNLCVVCSCNRYGSFSDACDEDGRCQCKEGFVGPKCGQCRNQREYIKDGVCTRCDECTQLLFSDIDRLTAAIEDAYDLFKDGLHPPWKILDGLIKRNKQLSKTFNYKINKAEQILTLSNVSADEETLKRLLGRTESLNADVMTYTDTSNHLKNDSDDLVMHIKSFQKRIRDVVATLENFGKQQVDLKGALKKANKILGAINENLYVVDVQEEHHLHTYTYCNKVGEEVDRIYQITPPLPFELFSEFNKKLNDIEAITRKVAEDSDLVSLRNDQSFVIMTNLKRKIEHLTGLKENNEMNIEEIEVSMNAIADVISKIERNCEDMASIEFDDLAEMQTKLDTARDESDDLEELFLRAAEHVEELENTVRNYQNIFNFTKDEWKTIKASGAYEEIANGIKSARKIADEARKLLSTALNILDPKDSDTLIDKTNLAHAQSDRLKHRIVNLKDITNSFNAIKNKLGDFKYQLLETGKANNDLNQVLRNLEFRITSQGDTVEKLYEVIQNSSDISERMRLIDKRISNLNISTRYDLFKKYQEYLNLTSKEEIDKMKDNITKTEKLLRQIFKSLEVSGSENHRDDQDRRPDLEAVTSRIKELQNKILYAKQVADSVNVAIGLSNCSMYYSLSKTEVLRNMAITFKCINCHLLTWENPQSILKLRIANGRAILTLDDEDQVELSTEKDDFTKMERTLFIERVGSLLQMKFDEDINWRKVQIGSKLLVIDSGDYIQIGDGLMTQANAYVYKLTINDDDVGLWKFAKTWGKCKGLSRANTREREGARPFYSGNGYRMYGTAPRLTPAKFNLRYDFATFDENSLIYLAQEIENPCAYIALTLENGRLKFEAKHNNGKTVSLKTEERFNDGHNYYAEVAMAYSNRLQHYSLKTDFATTLADEKLDNRAVFRIKRAHHFTGGLSPTLNSSCLNVNVKPFLGFLSNEELSNETVSSGVTEKTGDLRLDKAWFYGNGFVSLNIPFFASKGTQKLESISFIVRPLNSYVAIMEIEKFGVISLSNRLLQIDLKKESYSSTRPLTLSNYNVVSIVFKKDKISLTINGEDEVIYRNKSENIQKTETLNVIIGSAQNYNKLNGGLSDLMINNERVLFSAKTVTSFTNAEIGREIPLMRKTVVLKGLIGAVNVTNTMQNTQGCATTANYQTDPNAVKLGDKSNSYIQIKTAFWKKDFKIEFEFRSFYPNGVLFISVGNTGLPHYNFLELREGRVSFHAKGRRKIVKHWPITFAKRVNDGEWHKIKIVKKNNKRVQALLDGEGRKPVRIPKNVVRNEIFFGGVPPNYTDYVELRDKIMPFRGCFKNLLINGEAKLLGKNTKDVTYKNPTQCFPKVEEGAYFGGDAYAIYKESFRVNKILELSFQFRSAEQNGIFLSVSNYDNYPALSVELQNGAVVMTVNMGNGATSNVTNNLNWDYALCDNVWHNVTAMYSSSELTVMVDGIRKSWVQSELNSLMDEIDAPLYIGGLPDNAPVGTLKTRENFKGCIRKLKIEDEPKDWTDMEELNNVLLNSCPIVPAGNV